MNDSTIVVVLVLFVTTIIGLAVLVVGLSWARKFQNAGGVEALRQKLQESKIPTKVYPAVSPTPKPRTALGCSVILVMLMIAAIAVGVFVQQKEAREVRLLEREGVVAVATVGDKKIEHGSDNDEIPYIYYTFRAVTADGATREYGQWKSVRSSFYNQTDIGATLEVVYVPGSPNINRLRDLYTPGKMQYWGVLIAAGIALPCLALGAGQLNRYRHARRLDAEGMQAITRIMEHYTEEDSDGNTYYIIYELPGMGPVRQATTRNFQARHPVGSSVQLLYLPDNPLIFRLEDEKHGFASHEI
ncbi:MAG: hypothetical protein JXA21_12600 [Anaerolineae bacterium]|nr:hypothetical protein [Anaerolineae bacterium]